MDCSEIEYELACHDGQRPRVRGIQVGRLAVRDAGGIGIGEYENGATEVLDRWRIDHHQIGICLISCATREEAHRIADDMSRFAAADLDATTPEELKLKFGPDIDAWMCATRGESPRRDFRTWRRDQRERTYA